MNDNPGPLTNSRSVLNAILLGVAKGVYRVALTLTITFAIGTAAGAFVCLYYGMPLMFSVVGGMISLGVAVALVLNS